MYEGGIRVPGIIRWPGKTKPGSVSKTPISGVDILPTFCEIAGIEPPKDRAIDGTSFLPIFAGKPLDRKTPLYWQFPRSKSEVKVAMRDGDWKLLARLTGPDINRGADITEEENTAQKTAELTGFELYNLAKTVDESQDLRETQPERFAALKSADGSALSRGSRRIAHLAGVGMAAATKGCASSGRNIGSIASDRGKRALCWRSESNGADLGLLRFRATSGHANAFDAEIRRTAGELNFRLKSAVERQNSLGSSGESCKSATWSVSGGKLASVSSSR